jgi:cyclic lactone autoinducer peptide
MKSKMSMFLSAFFTAFAMVFVSMVSPAAIHRPEVPKELLRK